VTVCGENDYITQAVATIRKDYTIVVNRYGNNYYYGKILICQSRVTIDEKGYSSTPLSPEEMRDIPFLSESHTELVPED